MYYSIAINFLEISWHNVENRVERRAKSKVVERGGPYTICLYRMDIECRLGKCKCGFGFEGGTITS